MMKKYILEAEWGGIFQELGQFDTLKEINEFIKDKENTHHAEILHVYECKKVKLR